MDPNRSFSGLGNTAAAQNKHRATAIAEPHRWRTSNLPTVIPGQQSRVLPGISGPRPQLPWGLVVRWRALFPPLTMTESVIVG